MSNNTYFAGGGSTGHAGGVDSAQHNDEIDPDEQRKRLVEELAKRSAFTVDALREMDDTDLTKLAQTIDPDLEPETDPQMRAANADLADMELGGVIPAFQEEDKTTADAPATAGTDAADLELKGITQAFEEEGY